MTGLKNTSLRSALLRWIVCILPLGFLFSCNDSSQNSLTTGNETIAGLALKADQQFGAIEDAFGAGNDWPTQKAQLLQLLSVFLGEMPSQRAPLDLQVLSEEVFPDYIRRKVSYTVEPGERISAYLLVPIHFPLPRPAVLALHQTVDQGKQEPIGLKGDPGMAYGLEMVLRGYVVLAPDTITAGERVLTGEIFFDTTAFDSANPNWSAMGKMLWDHQRGIDLLQTIKEVHSDRIGVIGHSLGGYNALFLAAFDERIKAVAVSCPYTRIQTDPGKERWSRSTGFIHFPKLRPYVAPDSSMTVPWDFHNVLSLIVPRPLFQSIALNDTIFPNSTTVAQIHMFVWPMYNAMNSAQNLITIFNQGEHGFPNEAREMAYEFLDNIL